MRTLFHSLQDQDLGYLRIIAELWGFELPSGSSRELAKAMAEWMSVPDTLEEMIEALPPEASEALHALGQLGGKSPWNDWERKFGPMRIMGPGRRDREKPWRAPVSGIEGLWYRGLLGRAFIDTPKGPEEFAYLPQEILAWLQAGDPQPLTQPIEQISPPAHRLEPAATIIDDCTTVLAALRRFFKPASNFAEVIRPFAQSHLIHPKGMDLYLALLKSIGILEGESLQADPEAVREFLLADRMLSLHRLYSNWKRSTQWNDLAALPGLRSGADAWPNDPPLAREYLIRWLAQLQVGRWYSLSALIRAIYQEDPAFQRPAGNFDTWYLRDSEGIPLDGIEHWYAVEGALLSSLLKGPLRWFGAIQLGRDHPGGPVTSISPTQLSRLLEDPRSILPSVTEKDKATIRADGQISVPRLAPRSMRYQLARILDWEMRRDQNYHYRLSIRAIQEAERQDLNLNQVRTILAQASETELPPSTLQALQRFEEQGYEAQINEHWLLRVSDSSLLSTLLSNPATKRYIHEVLNDRTAVVRSDQWQRLVQAAARLGILVDGP